MRECFVVACMVGLTALALAQGPKPPVKFGDSTQSGAVSPGAGLDGVFQAKVNAEWNAISNKDKKAYAELLADDYQGVEVDGKGERNKIQAVSELVEGNVFSYTLWGFRLIPLGSDAAFVVYEVTMQFPPKAQVHYSRVYITELWVKRAEQWKELHYQETHVK
jgi:hypothetical protein